MYDALTLDQLRGLVAVVEEGSFSAAARKLQRVQSAISTSMANLETQLAVPLWDRSTKIATLTPQGQALLGAARRVLAEVDGLKRLASGMLSGLEASVSLCFDALFPLEALIELCRSFAKAFPTVDLRINTQVMSAVSARVLDGSATLGVVSPAGIARGLTRHALAPILMIPVVSPKHPLARLRGRLQLESLSAATQIVLSELDPGGVADQAVLSQRTWRVTDLHTKRMMLRAGLGWGNLPEHVARQDLRSGHLVAIQPDVWGKDEHKLYLSAIYRSDTQLGPAHRWLLQELGTLCAQESSLVVPRRRVSAPKVTKRRRRLAR
jgi:DNA-binding transcriptional LysR family regulator